MVDYQHYLAHRYYYEQAKGPIPDGYHVDHLCVSRTKGRGGSRACCNPEHLEAVPPIVNTRRAQSHKLDSTKAREIKRLKKGGTTNVELAIRFGVDAGTIKNVLKGRTWREADEPPSRGELVRALNVLLDGGLLTQEEFEAKGLDLLDRG